MTLDFNQPILKRMEKVIEKGPITFSHYFNIQPSTKQKREEAAKREYKQK